MCRSCAELPGDAAVEKLLEMSGEVDELWVNGRDMTWLYRFTNGI
jgi:hypothetical protein